MPQLLPLPVNQRAIAAMLTPFYFLFQSKKLLLRLAMLVMSVGMMSGVVGQATVTNDKPDYAPRSNAVFTGAGFQAFEQVQLKVKNLNRPCNTVTTDSSYLPWTVTADANGAFVTNWTVCDCPGDSLRLKATGLTSARIAYAYFTDGNFQFGALGLPSNTSVIVDYTISGSGGGNGSSSTPSFIPPATGGSTINNKTITADEYILTFNPDPPIGGINYTILNYGLRIGNPSQPTNIQKSNFFNIGGSGANNAALFIANYGALVATNVSTTYGSTAVALTSKLYSNYQTASSISGETITFYIDGVTVGTATTNASGVASLNVDLTSLPAPLGFLNAGSYTISSSFAGDASYLPIAADNSTSAILTVGKAPSVTTVTISGAPFIYTGSPITPASVSVTGAGGVVLATPTANYANNTNAGTATASYSYAGDANHEGSSDSKNFTIGKKSASITPTSTSKSCGQADPTFTGTFSGFITTDNVTPTYTRTAGETVLGSPYTISATLTVAASVLNNYDVTYNTALFTINGVTIDASTSSATVPIGQTARLKAVVTDGVNGVEGVAVKFEIKNSSGSIIQTKNTTSGANGLIDIPADALTLGVYQVIATAGAGCGTSTAYITMYDANENFVTGGGWISSPAGALTADPLAVGKANFGFVSKYKKGSSQVDGNTEFQFQAGNVNFKSTMHESGSLVISGGKATYRGTGTVNGLTGYKFVIVAIDGNWNNGVNPDRFRIKITTTSGQTVYDNQMNSAENADDATELGGGSIVIHEVKKKTSNRMDAPALVIATQEFNVKVLGNPSLTTFRLQLQGSNMQEKFTVKVVDVNGRLIEVQQNLFAGQVIELGSKYTQGTYFAEVTQGTNRKVVKLVKISRD